MKKLAVVFIIAAMGISLLAVVFGESVVADPSANSWYVCKYIGPPGVNEVLQTGQNPIFVDEHAIMAQTGLDTVSIGDEFVDAQGHSVVIDGPYAPPGLGKGNEPVCPVSPPSPTTTTPTTPPTTSPPPTPPTTTATVSPTITTSSPSPEGNLGSIKITKQTIPDGSNVGFRLFGAFTGKIFDGESIFRPVSPGTYVVREKLRKGWKVFSIECDDTDSGPGRKKGMVIFRVGKGEDVSCTITNIAKTTVKPTETTAPPAQPPALAFTGTDVVSLGAVAILLLILGTGILRFGVRKTRV